MLEKIDILQINRLFDSGKVVNEGSLDFALSTVRNTKDWKTQLAYIIRAILIDHVFQEGNKRTAAAVFVAYCKEVKVRYDIFKIDGIIINIIEKNISNIKEIRRLIEDAIVR